MEAEIWKKEIAHKHQIKNVFFANISGAITIKNMT